MDGLKSNTSREKFKTDEVVMDFYLKFELLEKFYYKPLVGVVIRRGWNTSLRIIQDKVNKDNIDLVLSEIDDFVKPYQSSGTAENGTEVYNEVMKILNKIKNN